MAMKFYDALKEKGYSFLTDSNTNQIFPILPKELIAELSKKYLFYVWKDVDQNSAAIRLITSWATEEKKVDEFIADLK
jgi:threonine aldolase